MSVIHDSSGEQSTIRVATLGTLILILGTWCVVSFQTQELQPISVEMVAIVMTVLGAKVIQKGKEKT